MSSRRSGSVEVVGQGLRFSAVGAVSYAIDLGVFDLLLVAGPGPFREPLLAKTVGVVVATLAAWVGMRLWTFRAHRQRRVGRELGQFLVANAAGYAINLAVLALSRYGLGLRSVLADDIAANVVGAAAGGLVRFVLYRRWVYRAEEMESD